MLARCRLRAIIEAPFELGERPDQVLVVHRLVGGDDRRLDIGEDRVEPMKRRVAGTVATAAGDDRMMIATGVGQPTKTGEPVGHHEPDVLACLADRLVPLFPGRGCGNCPGSY